MHLSYSSNSGAARICQRGPKRGSEATERGGGCGRGGGGFPLPCTVGRCFENSCMKTKFLAHWMPLLGGWLCEVTYFFIPIPYSPLLLKNYFTPIKGAGTCPLVPSAICQWRWCSQDLSTGAKARERSDRAGGGCGRGVSPSNCREIFENSCMKTAFSCTLDTIMRGSLCTGIDQFPTLFLFSFFS